MSGTRIATLTLAVAGLFTTTSCGAPHPGFSNDSLTVCYRAIPAARTAINDRHASLVSIHRISVDKVMDHIPPSAQQAVHLDNSSAVCVLAFKGTFAAGQVQLAPPGATGDYAVVIVSSRHLNVLATVVLDHLPSSLGKRTL